MHMHIEYKILTKVYIFPHFPKIKERKPKFPLHIFLVVRSNYLA